MGGLGNKGAETVFRKDLLIDSCYLEKKVRSCETISIYIFEFPNH